jgi:cellulose synthase/poly-beta-1,6-N-acetylglucosamine synthase-like glycosyltransferase
MPLGPVSVVIPAYNASQFIVETVESVLRQTFTDFELLIVNEPFRDLSKSLRFPCAGRSHGSRSAGSAP